MAQFTIYKSTDGSAPSLDGTVGSLVNLLDKCLVTGYGAKAAAGWTKPFTGTNKAAFRPGAGTRFYLRVQDDGPGAGAAREARITGYETMSSVDSGTGPFPTAAQGVGGVAMLVARKSTTADATARTWVVVADARTVYVFVQTEGTSNYYAWAFGDIYSFKTDDAYNCMIIARDVENSNAPGNEVFGTFALTINTNLGGHFIARAFTQLGNSTQCTKCGDSHKSASTASVGQIPFTNPEDGAIYLSQIWVHDANTAPIYNSRGRLRGIWQWLHAESFINDGDTFSGNGSGELSGKTFLAIKTWLNSSNVPAIAVIETSNTLETN